MKKDTFFAQKGLIWW